jgi:hypothetical protein
VSEEAIMDNKVVARYANGRLTKGTTLDFSPGKDVFHVIDVSAPTGTHPVEIRTKELKALFFVKDLVGDPNREATAPPGPPRPAAGRRVRVVFRDGEVMVGTTTGYQPDRPGFFLEPVDSSRNEERCYVVARAARQVVLL